jgi:hypothetical protein
MELNGMNDQFQNGAGDTLSRIESTETHALFQVIDGKSSSFKDVFFLAKLESKFDPYSNGKKLHLTGGESWEASGHYFNGKDAAMKHWQTLNPDPSQEYYNNQFKK